MQPVLHTFMRYRAGETEKWFPPVEASSGGHVAKKKKVPRREKSGRKEKKGPLEKGRNQPHR